METYQLPFTSVAIKDKLQLIDENANKLLTDKDLENLAKKSEIPNVSNFVTINEVRTEIKNAQFSGGSGEVDLSGYVTEDELAAKGYITDISSKADKNHTHSEYLTEHQSLTNYATKDYVADEIVKAQLEGEDVDLSGYAKEQWVKDQGYLTEHQDLSEYITKSELTAENYLTEETLDTALASKNFLPSCSTPNEGQFLRVVGGVATWTNIAEAEEATF